MASVQHNPSTIPTVSPDYFYQLPAPDTPAVSILTNRSFLTTFPPARNDHFSTLEPKTPQPHYSYTNLLSYIPSPHVLPKLQVTRMSLQQSVPSNLLFHRCHSLSQLNQCPIKLLLHYLTAHILPSILTFIYLECHERYAGCTVKRFKGIKRVIDEYSSKMQAIKWIS